MNTSPYRTSAIPQNENPKAETTVIFIEEESSTMAVLGKLLLMLMVFTFTMEALRAQPIPPSILQKAEECPTMTLSMD